MDGAADRVDLRGLGLLARARTLRRDDAERVRAAARRATETARDAVRQAGRRLDAHRSAWREAEASLLDGMTGHTLDGTQFQRNRDLLDRMADEAIALAKALPEAEARFKAAEKAEAAARVRVVAAERRLDQGEKIRIEITKSRQVRESALEEQALEDDLSQRYRPQRSGPQRSERRG